MLDSAVLEKFKLLIQNYCGMMITEVHSKQLEKYLSEKIDKTQKTCAELYEQISTSKDSMIELINAVVVNETYFFREEKQFKFLQEYLNENFQNKQVVMWSAACSSGEEPYSLACLGLTCEAEPIVYATDIDTEAIIQVKNGVYGANSFRPDGSSFTPYLEQYLSSETNKLGQKIFSVNNTLKEKLICGRANLLELDQSSQVPENNTVDIILIRNVFIYFDKLTRDMILTKLSKKLKEGGILLFSISEIGGINPTDKKLPLVKKTKDSIYYFEKTDGQAAAVKTEIKPIDNSRIEQLMKNYVADKPESVQPLQTAPITLPQLSESPQEIWNKISDLIEKRAYAEGQKLLDNYKPPVNQLCTKYYYQGFLNEAQNNNETALTYYEKAGFSNPHFWPAYFKVATILQNNEEPAVKRKRHDALIKAATILEEEKSESECYTYLLGAFSSSYFYKLCNDYLKKELS